MATNKTRDNAHIRCIPTHVFKETLLLELCRDASCLCIIPTSLVCVLFGPAIPTYFFSCFILIVPIDMVQLKLKHWSPIWSNLETMLWLDNMTVKVLSGASGHKQVKLHGLLLNFINFINSLKEREKRRKRPQRGVESSGSVTHTNVNYLPITDISTLCLNRRNVTDHVCPYICWFTKRKQYTPCTRNAGLVPWFPDLFKA